MLETTELGWWGVAIANPFGAGVGLYDESLDGSWLLYALYLTNWINLLLLMFNVLVPMFPLDGGRILQALLWRKFGYVRSMRFAVRSGYVGAIVLALGYTILVAWMETDELNNPRQPAEEAEAEAG